MLEITEDYKKAVIAAVLEARNKYSGTQEKFAAKIGVNPSVFSSVFMHGKLDKKITPEKWLDLGYDFGVQPNERKWICARTDVFNTIEDDVLFCKAYHKSRIMVDKCAIGKTYAAKYLSKTLTNCFYMDCSQAKKATVFVRELAKCIGIEPRGHSIHDLKERIKCFLRALPNPIVILDEAGDLKSDMYVELKEFWNGTEYRCGWYMMGAVGLKVKIDYGVSHEIPGFEELFSRFSDKYTTVVPTDVAKKNAFYKKLVLDVLTVNEKDPKVINKILPQCLLDSDGEGITGLRRAESLLILNQQ